MNPSLVTTPVKAAPIDSDDDILDGPRDDSPVPPVAEPPAKKPRGRPRGSKNAPGTGGPGSRGKKRILKFLSYHL